MIFRIINAIEFGLFAGVDFIGLATRSDFALAANHSDARTVTVFVHVDSERAGFFNGKCQVGSIDLIEVAFPQFANAEVQGALGDAHLRDVFVQIEKGKGGHAAKMQRRLPRLQLGAGILVGPKLVADSDGAILRRGGPVLRAGGLKRDVAV